MYDFVDSLFLSCYQKTQRNDKMFKPNNLLFTAFISTLFIFSGCEGEDAPIDDEQSLVSPESSEDPFSTEAAEAEVGFRGASVCQQQCRTKFSNCLSSCSFNPRSGFELVSDERCLAVCEQQLRVCNAACQPKPQPQPQPQPGMVTVQGPCFTFTGQASGGLGGFRVLGAGPQEFFRFNKRFSRKICTGRGKKVTFDLEKLQNPNIDVTVTVQGKSFRFPRGDRGAKFHNQWYRKYFTVYVK